MTNRYKTAGDLRIRIAELETEQARARAEWNEQYAIIDADLQGAWKIIKTCAQGPAWCAPCREARTIRRSRS